MLNQYSTHQAVGRPQVLTACWPDTSASCHVGYLQHTLAIRGFLYFHTNCEIICSSSVKNTVGSLIGIALNL